MFRLLAVCGCAAGILLAAGTAAVFASLPGAPDLAAHLALLSAGLLTSIAGLVITWRVPRNSIGVLIISVGVLEVMIAARLAWHWLSHERPDVLSQPGPVELGISSTIGVSVFVPLVAVILSFPSGRFESRWARRLMVATAVTTGLFVASGLLAETNLPPYQHVPVLVSTLSPGQMISVVLAAASFFATLLVSVTAGLLRVRRADGIVRVQLKWVVLGSCGFLVFPFACGVEVLLTGSAQWPSLVVAWVGMLSLPLGIAVGMLGHDLFDVDRAVASVVVWTLVATSLGLAFGVVIALGGALVGAGSPSVAAVATALCALLLAPLHRRVSQTIGQRFHPLRRAGHAAIQTVEQSVSVGSGEPEDLQAVLAAAVRDPDLRVGYVRPDDAAVVDASGEALDASRATPVRVAGEPIGWLMAPRLPDALTRELAERAAMLVGLSRLRMHLRQSVREIEASRARIVAAEDTARRRIERNLHDGAQQRLVALGMALRLAQRRGESEDLDIDRLIDGAVAELGTAVAELRQLAHGIRPSALDDGLFGALEALARSTPMPIHLGLDESAVACVPEAATATMYYVASESLTNVLKHASARRIRLTLECQEDVVTLAVRDDGVGGADLDGGAGLTGLQDRIAAVGGRLRVVSRPGDGTLVEATLPCAS